MPQPGPNRPARSRRGTGEGQLLACLGAVRAVFVQPWVLCRGACLRLLGVRECVCVRVRGKPTKCSPEWAQDSDASECLLRAVI